MRRQGLFLLELLLMLLFFALCAAVCLQIFAQAERISDESAARSGAVNAARSAAACFQAADGRLEDAAALSGGALTEDGLEFLYSQEWLPSDIDAAEFCLRLEADGPAAFIAVFRTGTPAEPIYTLEVRAVDYDR